MLASGELGVLIINIESMRDSAPKSEHEIYNTILVEVRKTAIVVADNDSRAIAAVKHLTDTYVKIQAM